MTSNQISKKLTAAGIIESDRVSLKVGRDKVQVVARDSDGDISRELSTLVMRKIVKALGWKSGGASQATHGGWTVEAVNVQGWDENCTALMGNRA